MSSNIGDLSVQLKADIGQFLTKITEAKSGINQFAVEADKAASKVGSSLKDVAKSFDPVKLAVGGITTAIAAISLDNLKEAVFGVMEARAELYKMSVNTGISVEALSALKGVAAATGTEFSNVTGLTNKFNKAVSDAQVSTTVQAKAFRNLGIDIRDGSGNLKDTLTLQQEAAAKLNTYTDGIQKDTYYRTLWGKSAMESKLFLKELGSEQELNAKVTTAQAKQAEELEKSIKKLNKQMNEWKRDLADEVIPWMAKVTDKILELKKAVGDGGWAKVLSQIWGPDRLSGDSVYGKSTSEIGVMLSEYDKKITEEKALISKMENEQKNKPKLFSWYEPSSLIESRTALKDLEDKKAFAQRAYNLQIEEQGKGILKAKAEKDAAAKGGPPAIKEETDQSKAFNTELINQATKLLDIKNKMYGIQESNLSRTEKEIALGKYVGEDTQKLLDNAKELDAVTLEGLHLEDQKKANQSLADMIINQGVLLAEKKSSTEQSKAEAEVQKRQFAEANQGYKDLYIAQARALDIKKQTSIVDDGLKSIQNNTDKNLQSLDKEIKQRTESANVIRRQSEEEKVLQYFQSLLDNKEIQGNAEQMNRIYAQRDAALEAVRAKTGDLEKQESSYLVGATAAVIKYTDGLRNVAAATEAAFTNVFNSLETTMVDFVKTGKLNFTSLISTMVDELIKLQVRAAMTPIFNSLQSGMGGIGNWVSSALGFGGGGSTASAGSSSGGGYFGGLKMPSANGNAFTSPTRLFGNGGVLGGPAVFPIQGGMGMAGEAGPEGILPLRRNANGQLGVISNGSGSVTNNISVSVNVQGNADQNTANQIGESVVRAIAKSEIVAAQRPGGSLNRMAIAG